jgi:hypothetical protein
VGSVRSTTSRVIGMKMGGPSTLQPFIRILYSYDLEAIAVVLSRKLRLYASKPGLG